MKKSFTNRHITTVLILLSIVLIDFYGFKDMLEFHFSGDDDLKNIYSAQRGIVDIFSDVMIKDFPELEVNNFYRPMVILSHKLDYSIWGLNPFGYQLTSLIIHITLSILVFFLARLLTGGNQMIAWLSAILFTSHPVNYLIKNCSQRTDMMAGLFLTASLFLFLKYLSVRSCKRLFIISSIFVYVLAFFSKETAIILPFLIFSYLMIFSEPILSHKRRAVQAFKRTMPLLIITIIMVAWRAYVLKDLVGGYSAIKHGPLYYIVGAPSIILRYVNYLFNIPDYLDFFPIYGAFFICIFIMVFLLLYKARIISKTKPMFLISHNGKLLVFLIIWILLPLGLYVSTLNLARWYMYIPVIPFSIILSVKLVEGLQAIKGDDSSSLFKRISMPVILVILIFSFLMDSSFKKIGEFKEWNADVKTVNIFLEKLLEIVYELPVETSITIDNTPVNIADISPYGIKFWLSIVYPQNKVKDISLQLGPPMLGLRDDLGFEILRKEEGFMQLNLIFTEKDNSIK